MVKIKKFRKPLLEDDAQAQVPAAAPQQPAAPVNNTAQPAAAPQQQNTAPNTQQQNGQQQNVQQQNGQQQNDPNEISLDDLQTVSFSTNKSNKSPIRKQ